MIDLSCELEEKGREIKGYMRNDDELAMRMGVLQLFFWENKYYTWAIQGTEHTIVKTLK